MRILFLATLPETEASTRFRMLQYFPALRAAGHEPVFSSFYPSPLCRARHPGGALIEKVQRLVRGFAARARSLAQVDEFDLVVAHRELLPHGWNHLAPLLARRSPLVFDFDDAVWLPRDRGLRGMIAARSSTKWLVAAATQVVAGNEYLAAYARRWHDRVTVLPTVVDTTRYHPRPRPPGDDGLPVIGWIGSPTTYPYLRPLLPLFDELARSFRFRLRIVGAGEPVRLEHMPVETPDWRLAAEEQLFGELDIGVYPLDEDTWSQGKCGFKAIQYMASGVPSVVSPVGVVREIVRHQVDGLWARSRTEWKDALARLLTDEGERRRMAAAGRPRIETLYSLQAVTPRYLDVLERAAGMRRGAAAR